MCLDSPRIASPLLLVFLGFELMADPLDHWTRRAVDGAPTLRAVTYGNGRFVATADHGVILTSPDDGVSWAPCASPSAAPLWSIAFGNGVFVAAEFPSDGNPGVLVSSNGTNWARIDRGWPSIRNVIFTQNTFVAAQNYGDRLYGAISTSQDGMHWVMQLKTGYVMMCCGYGNGIFLCAGDRTYTSSNAIDWTVTPYEAYLHFASVAFGKGVFVALDWINSTPAVPYTTSDGMHWTAWSKGGPPFHWGAVTFANDTFVIASATR